MNFRDTSTIEGSPTKQPGVQFVSDCGAWKIVASDIRPDGGAPDEWHVWQCVRGADPRNPHGLGYVRRLSRARFVARDAAMSAAALLAALPATMSVRIIRDAVADHVRGMAALGIFAGLRLAHFGASGLQNIVRRRHDAEY